MTNALPYKITWATDLDTSPIGDVYLIPNLVIRGGANEFVGQSGAGKSVLMKNIGNAFATGSDFLGKPTPKMRTVIADLETPEAIFREQIKTLGKPKELGYMRGEDWHDLKEPGMLDTFKRVIIDVGVEVLILDPLSIAWRTVDENSNSEADEQISKLKHMCSEAKVTLIYTWNTGQNNPSEKVFIGRGATARADRADMIVYFTLDPSIGRSLKVVKDKYHEPTYTASLTTVPETMGYTLRSETVGTSKPVSRGEQCTAEILTLLASGTKARREIVVLLQPTFSEKAVDRGLKSLVDQQKLDSNKGTYTLI